MHITIIIVTRMVVTSTSESVFGVGRPNDIRDSEYKCQCGIVKSIELV